MHSKCTRRCQAQRQCINKRCRRLLWLSFSERHEFCGARRERERAAGKAEGREEIWPFLQPQKLSYDLPQNGERFGASGISMGANDCAASAVNHRGSGSGAGSPPFVRTIYSKLIEKQSICLPKHKNIYHPSNPKYCTEMLERFCPCRLYCLPLFFSDSLLLFRTLSGEIMPVPGLIVSISFLSGINGPPLSQRSALAHRYCIVAAGPRELPHLFARISLCLICRLPSWNASATMVRVSS